MDGKMKNPDAEIAGIRKVVSIEINTSGSLWVNGLIKQGWELLRITDQYYVMGHRSDAATIPRLGIE